MCLRWIAKGQCRAIFGIDHMWVIKYTFWKGGNYNETDVRMYLGMPHLLPPTLPMDELHEVILMSRAQYTLDEALAGPIHTNHGQPTGLASRTLLPEMSHSLQQEPCLGRWFSSKERPLTRIVLFGRSTMLVLGGGLFHLQGHLAKQNGC